MEDVKLLAVDEGADGVAAEGVGEVAGRGEVEDDDGDMIVHAEAERGGIHHVEPLRDTLVEGDGVVAFGIRVFAGVGIIDAIDLCGFEDDIGSHFAGAEGGSGVGGEERVAGARSEYDDSVFIELGRSAAAYEGFRDVFHFDGGLDDAGDAVVGECAFEGEGVHDGCEHAHVIGGGAVHAAGGCAGSAPEVAAADDDAELESLGGGFADFEGDAVDDFRGNVIAGIGATKSLAAEFEDGAAEGAGVFGAVWHVVGF